jgi:predicted amidophosphoribosyltransferase
MRYCDYCGRTVPYNTKYCRHCGKTLRDNKLDDTAPFSAITDEMLLISKKNSTALARKPGAWSKFSRLGRHISLLLAALWNKSNILSRLLALLFTCILIYIIVTFKTIKEYQILVSVATFTVVVYLWYRK